MIGGTISLTIPKLLNMEEGLVSPHWLVTTRITPSFPFSQTMMIPIACFLFCLSLVFVFCFLFFVFCFFLFLFFVFVFFCFFNQISTKMWRNWAKLTKCLAKRLIFNHYGTTELYWIIETFCIEKNCNLRSQKEDCSKKEVSIKEI